jgi:hypothetical protein
MYGVVIYLTPWPPFVFQNYGNISCTLVKFPGGRTHEHISFLCPKADMISFGTRLLGKEEFSIFALHTSK